MNKHFTEIDSTNAEMHRMMREDVENFSYITADYQTAGRGQVGNTWESEPNANLLYSVLVKPAELDVRRQFYLSMAVSVAIVEGIETAVGQKISELHIKWPNDIYYKYYKLGGILIENSLRNHLIASSIIGLGLNVNQREFVSDAPNPISLCHIVEQPPKPAEIAEKITESLKNWMPRVDMEDWPTIVNAYMSRLYRFDGKLHTFSADNQEFEATIKHIEPDGRLVLQMGNGEHKSFYFKEVEYINPVATEYKRSNK